MNVTVSCFGKFHAYYLAQQLHANHHLHTLITSYPARHVANYSIPQSKIKALWAYEAQKRLWAKAGRFGNVKAPASLYRQYDKAASRRVERGTDIVVSWSGSAKQTLARAKQVGAVAIVERGSSHIQYQQAILQEEMALHGVALGHPADWMVRRELEEYESADFIAIPSNFVRRTFESQGVPSEKLIQAGYGVDLTQFNPSDDAPDSTFRVVFAGSMSLRKGVHYLLQAFAELKLLDAELWLFGSQTPEIEPFFERYAGHYRYFGHVPQAALRNYYQQCSVFTMCSIEEGMAMVQLQAMASGLPLICTTNTGGDDLVADGENGFVLPIRDVAALKEKLVWLYENRPKCREMGRLASQSVKAGHSWQDYGANVIANYQRMLDI